MFFSVYDRFFFFGAKINSSYINIRIVSLSLAILTNIMFSQLHFHSGSC
jgi:hypothetical protein